MDILCRGRRDFFWNSTVDITVWKTLWRMWKALDYEQVMKVASWLWVILRNNISGKNRSLRRERAGKEEGAAPGEALVLAGSYLPVQGP